MNRKVPDSWSLTRVSEIATVTSGGTPDRTNAAFYSGVNPWVKSGEVNQRAIRHTEEHISDEAIENSSAKWVNAGAVLVAMYGATAGKVAKLMINATLNQAIAAVVLKKSNFCSDYLFHALEFSSDELLKSLQGSGQPNLSGGLIKELKLLSPPLPEQQKIASILTAVDEVIESTTAQINKLKDLKIGMMQELLTKGIGHTEFKDSPVGRIPKSWEVEPLANVFGMASGSTPSRKDSTYFSVSSDAIPWVKTMDLDDGIITKTTEKITQRAIKETSCKLLPIGSTLVAMYGGWNQIGRSGVLGIPAATNQAICALIPKTRVTGEFCNYWLISKRDNWKSIAASSRKDPNITKQDVEEFLIAIPPKQEQLDIVKILDVATHSVNIRQDKLRNLTNLKKALMHDLLTGKVRSI